LTKVLCLHPVSVIIHVNRIAKELIVLSRHQLVEIHEQEPIMVRGDGSQHFVELIDSLGIELIDMVEMFIRQAGHCRESDFDLRRTSDIDDGFDVTSKEPEHRNAYARARQLRLEKWIDEMVPMTDKVIGEEMSVVTATRNAVDVRK
jgi:hypothetical protein